MRTDSQPKAKKPRSSFKSLQYEPVEEEDSSDSEFGQEASAVPSPSTSTSTSIKQARGGPSSSKAPTASGKKQSRPTRSVSGTSTTSTQKRVGAKGKARAESVQSDADDDDDNLWDAKARKYKKPTTRQTRSEHERRSNSALALLGGFNITGDDEEDDDDGLDKKRAEGNDDIEEDEPGPSRRVKIEEETRSDDSSSTEPDVSRTVEAKAEDEAEDEEDSEIDIYALAAAIMPPAPHQVPAQDKMDDGEDDDFDFYNGGVVGVPEATLASTLIEDDEDDEFDFYHGGAVANESFEMDVDDEVKGSASRRSSNVPGLIRRHRPDFVPSAENANLGDLDLGHGYFLPAVFHRILRPYQLEGLRFLFERWHKGKGCILGDDMGLGKTIQIIALLTVVMKKTCYKDRDDQRRQDWIDDLREKGLVFPGVDRRNPKPSAKWPTCLIIAPSSVCMNWLEEFKIFGYFFVAHYGDNSDTKARVLREFKMGWYDVVVVSFETASREIDQLKDVDFSMIVADEVHRIKSPKTAVSVNLRRFPCQLRIGLTGTAIQNRLDEFYSVLDWSRPGELGSLEDWEFYISRPIREAQAHDVTADVLIIGRYRAEALVKKILPDFFLRRTKALIAHQMPKKKDLVVLCALTHAQLECFRRLEETEDLQLLLRKDDDCDCGERAKPKKRGECCYKRNAAGAHWSELIFKYISVYRKLSNHLALILPSEDDTPKQHATNGDLVPIALPNQDPRQVRYVAESIRQDYCGKWFMLEQLLKRWRALGVDVDASSSKVLIFSMSVKLLKILEFFIRGQGFSYKFLHGGVPLASRMDMVKEFQEDPGVFIFLISTATGGVGLNLTAANKVVIFDPSWNPSNDLQAMDRAFRIGQKRDVEVFRLVAAGSIEEVIYSRQVYKRQQSAIGYEAGAQQRNFDGVMGDASKKGELFGVKNLFSIRATGGSVQDTIERARLEIIEMDLALASTEAAAIDGDEERKLSLDDMPTFSEDRADESAFNYLKLQVQGREEGDDELAGFLAAAGVLHSHEETVMINNPAGEILIFKQAKQLKKLDRALLAKTKAQDVPAELKRLQAQSPKKKKDAFPVKSFEPAPRKPPTFRRPRSDSE